LWTLILPPEANKVKPTRKEFEAFGTAFSFGFALTGFLPANLRE